MYHVMSRGNRGDAIFLDDVDRHDWLKTLAEACLKTGWQVHAYCLMSNHYHLVVETPNANLVEGMAWLQSTYTIRLNHRHKLFGHVLSGRYKAQLVEGSGGGYLRTACDYVHLNPARGSAAAQRAAAGLSLEQFRFLPGLAGPSPELAARGSPVGRARTKVRHAGGPAGVRAAEYTVLTNAFLKALGSCLVIRQLFLKGGHFLAQ
jgi:REP element-mobilizing transposase RayT